MTGFNRMTVVAAAEVISEFHTHGEMEVLEVQWGVSGRCRSTSKSARVADLAGIATKEDPEVITIAGSVSLSRAIVETTLRAPMHVRGTESWKRLIAGLRFDGFEVVEQHSASESARNDASTESAYQLVRMLPSDIPELEFREAKSEVQSLLERYGLTVASGHLDRAISAFSRGEWSSANGELRNFYENCLNEIADRLGYTGADNGKAKRDFLGGVVKPPFLLADYNEWDPQKTQYIQALMNRLHPHGGHPGLSDEDDATFRLQITLITARLLLRRLDRRAG